MAGIQAGLYLCYNVRTMKKVAFFDIDGTIFRSSLVVELVERLIDAGVYPQAARERYEDDLVNWRNRTGPYERYIDNLVRTFMENIKGVHYGEMVDIGREVVAEKGSHVYRYTRDLVRQFKDDGYYLVAISQSPKLILDDFCQAHGFDKVYGRIYELGPQDRFTGNLIDVHLIENKANIAKRVFEQEGFGRAGSVAVGDTEGDIPLLESVETAICFNPTQKLYDHAKRNGWKVVVERKDVIYEL